MTRHLDELHLEYPLQPDAARSHQPAWPDGWRSAHAHSDAAHGEAIYRRPNTSKPAPGHSIYPYLLRDVVVTRPDQVWAMDITYFPMERGFEIAIFSPQMRLALKTRLSVLSGLEECEISSAVSTALGMQGSSVSEGRRRVVLIRRFALSR